MWMLILTKDIISEPNDIHYKYDLAQEAANGRSLRVKNKLLPPENQKNNKPAVWILSSISHLPRIAIQFELVIDRHF
jgi:hypothetical protein